MGRVDLEGGPRMHTQRRSRQVPSELRMNTFKPFSTSSYMMKMQRELTATRVLASRCSEVVGCV